MEFLAAMAAAACCSATVALDSSRKSLRRAIVLTLMFSCQAAGMFVKIVKKASQLGFSKEERTASMAAVGTKTG